MRFLLLNLLNLLVLAPLHAGENHLPAKDLVLDLDASKGVTTEPDGRVTKWVSEVNGKRFDFVKQDGGRNEPGSGRPKLLKDLKAIGGKPALEFLQQELVCAEEDAFDALTTGKGHTWAVVISVRPQRVGVPDVNSFFGNLRNGGKYEGLWGCLTDDNRPWYGVRNSLTFGRFDANNPQLLAPALELGSFHLLMGRMQAGTSKVRLDFFRDSPKPVASAEVPVVAAANPSRMAVGQERDAVEHPGKESFDGEIARFLIWERPLDDVEISAVIESLHREYHLAPLRSTHR
jgi:hypothetical protein